MSLDPIDYDVVALRELARRKGEHYVEDGFLWSAPSEGGEPLDDLAAVEHEVEWSGSLDERQKPYLKALPADEEARELVVDWLEGLVATAGFEGTVALLSYYESLGWITESVETDLHDHLLGAGSGSGSATPDRVDHVESLSRIVRLARLAGEESVETA